jgi:iron transport multicopper oxidase
MSASQYFYIEGHSFTIVEIDGVKIEPVEVDSVKLSTGQRYGVLLKTRNESNENFAIVQVTNIMMRQKFDVNWLIYNPDLEPKDKNAVKKIRPKDMNYVDDFTLRPRQSTLKLGKPDHDLSFTYDYDYFTSDNIRYYTMNGKPHLAPKVPTMNTIFSADSSTVLNPLIYGNATNAVILKKGEVVQITVNSMDHMRHPFHLHGHNFQVLAIGRREHFQYDDAAEAGFPEFPMVRDTVEVPSKGYVVLRFIADNPGVWFFHCHTEWHAVQGLGVVFIESPDYLLDNQELPNEFYQVCEAGGYEARGNAAGNKDMLNLTGEVNLDGDMETTSAETTSAETTLPAVVPTSSTEIPEEEEEKTQPNTEHQHTEVSLKKKTLVLVVYCSVMTSIAGLVALGIHRCNNKRIQKRGMLVHDYE